jgi:hypothetical protein
METSSQIKNLDFYKYDPSFFKRCTICGCGYFKRRKDVFSKWDKRKYCSHKCYFPMQKFKTVSSETKRKIAQKTKGRKHSLETRIKFSIQKMGDKNPAKRDDVKKKISQSLLGRPTGRNGEKCRWWKGGKTPFIKNLRGWCEYKTWRRSVFERDNWTCVLCGARNGVGVGKTVILNADHYPLPLYKIVEEMLKICGDNNKREFAVSYKPLWDISNGRTLCVDCHLKTDTMGRRKKTRS